MSADRLQSLQRELLAICHGGSFYETWARINGVPDNERVSLRDQISRQHAANLLRMQIHALDPNAALYFGWCAGEDRRDAEREFRAAAIGEQS